MNKISFWGSVIIMLLCFSCSSDEDDELSSKLIIGHWQSVSYYGYSINSNTGEKVFFEEKPDESLSIKFYEDGTCMFGSQLCSYKMLNNELDIFGSSSITFVIEELKSDKMVLSTASGLMGAHYIYTFKKVNN